MKTFKALCNYADWSSFTSTDINSKNSERKVEDKNEDKDIFFEREERHRKVKTPELHYNIQIHLPESRDPAVYDAIFKSLKEHFN